MSARHGVCDMQMNTLTPDIELVLDSDCVVRQATTANDVSDEPVNRWIGKPWSDTVTGIEPAALCELVLGTRKESVSPIFHVTQRFPSGLVVPFEYLTIRRDNGKEFVAIGRDVRLVANLQSRLAAARQSMERDYWKMRDLESRYRSLYEAASDPLLLIDSETLAVVEANPAAIAVLGLGADDGEGILTPSILETLAADDRGLAAASLKRARKSGGAPRILVRVGRQGEAYMLHARMLEQEDGRLLLVHLMSVADAPARQGAIQEDVFTADQIFNLSPDGIVVLDEHGQIQHANKAFLGLAEEATLAPIVGAPLARWIGSPGGDLKMLIDSLRLCESVRQFPTTIKGTLGGNTRVEVSAVLKSNPPPRFIAMYIRDIGRRLESPDQSEMLMDFLSGMAGRLGEAPLKEVVSSAVGLVERYYIEAALEAVEGNRTAAARILGVSRQGFYDKLARYQIDERPDNS